MTRLQKIHIKRFLAAITLGIGLICFGGGMDKAHAVAFAVGDIFGAVGSGQVQHYSAAGTLLETLNTGQGGFTTGMAFDSAGSLYVTNFSASNISKFDNTGALLASNFVANDAGADNESILFDSAGNFYVGQPDGTDDIIKRAADGTFLARFDVAINARGSDWIDLAADQTTMFYDGEGRIIKRFDVGSNTQLADFATLPGSGNAFALRLLGDGGLLVADGSNVKRLDSTGTVVQTYDIAGENTWFALNLDADNVSFWSGNFGTGNLYKFNIASGTSTQTISTGSGNLFGVTVFGEVTQGGGGGGNGQVPEPSTLLLLGSGLLGLVYFGRKRIRG